MQKFSLKKVVLIALFAVCVSEMHSAFAEANNQAEVFSSEAKRLHWCIADKPGMPISQVLLERFADAARLSKAGHAEQSLAAWESLLSPASATEQPVATVDFVGVAYMRKAWVQMDLSKYDEAKQTLTSPVLLCALPTFSERDRGEYYFSLANTKGSLKDQAGLEADMGKAVDIYRKIGEEEMVAVCYRNSMLYARANRWKSFENRLLAEGR